MSADAAARDFCLSRNVDSSPTHSGFTGAYVWRFVSTEVHPTYEFFGCEYNEVPTPAVPMPQTRYISDYTWVLRYRYACENHLSAYDDVKHTCSLPGIAPPQPAFCNPSDRDQTGQNEKGHPIDSSTQQKLLREHDYLSPQGLEFTRKYNSANLANNSFSSHWRHNYSRQVVSSLDTGAGLLAEQYISDPLTGDWYGGGIGGGITLPEQDASQFLAMYFIRDDGNYVYFTSIDHGTNWLTDSGANYRVKALNPDANGHATQWELTTPADEAEIYAANTGLLQAIKFRDGRQQTLHYSDANTPSSVAPRAGLLIQVTDNFDRSLRLSYNANGFLSTMTDPAGRDFSYAYDDHGLLGSVTFPDGLKRVYHYDEPIYFAGRGNDVGLGHLTGISDEISNGLLVRLAIYQYDFLGKPFSTEYVGGVDKFVMNHSTNTVLDPLGTERKYTYVSRDGMQLLSAVSQPGGAGCAASAQGITYDADLNISRMTDFNGKVTSYTYYPRNLKKTKTEAAGTAQARTTTYEWHAQYRLPTKIAEPKRLTTYAYDASGNLLSRTEQATTDLTGAAGLTPAVTGTARKTSTTYNAVGQVESVTEPRSDTVVKTSYTYNSSSGDLESVTDAAGLITRFSNYNAHGDVGRIEDSNGTITELRYTPRRWLETSTEILADSIVRTTSYTYDGRGSVKSVTQPDGSSTLYNYDDAGRLVNIADNFDNSIDYVLDAVGNRILEQVRDPNGVLVSQIKRSYDALNRLQQINTGNPGQTQDGSTNTVLSSAAEPARTGYPLRITASVTGNAPTGEVKFMDGAHPLGISFLREGKADLELANLPLGPHLINAFYSGDNNNAPSSAGTLSQTIIAATATASTLHCPTPSVVDANVRCTVNVSTSAANAPNLNGQAVQLLEGTSVLGSGTLAASATLANTATVDITLIGLTTGNHLLLAQYAGDPLLSPSASAQFTQTVSPHLPQISRLSLGGLFVVGTQYSVTLNANSFTYAAKAEDGDLAGVARAIADRLRLTPGFLATVADRTITVTGPVNTPFALYANLFQRGVINDREV
jgi:YD repeat-containing protein